MDKADRLDLVCEAISAMDDAARLARELGENDVADTLDALQVTYSEEADRLEAELAAEYAKEQEALEEEYWGSVI